MCPFPPDMLGQRQKEVILSTDWKFARHNEWLKSQTDEAMSEAGLSEIKPSNSTFVSFSSKPLYQRHICFVNTFFLICQKSDLIFKVVFEGQTQFQGYGSFKGCGHLFSFTGFGKFMKMERCLWDTDKHAVLCDSRNPSLEENNFKSANVLYI